MRVFWLALLVAAGALLARADDAPTVRVFVPNVFSYQAPPGWTLLKVSPDAASQVPYPVAIDPGHDPDHPRALITVNVDSSPQPLLDWCRGSLERSRAQFAEYQARIGDPEPFTTAAGVRALRAPIYLTAGSKPLRYEMYFFDAPGGQKLAVACTCPAEDVDHYLPLFETAMKTFVAY